MTFVELISNRVLDVQLLHSSDHITLYKCIQNILQSYDVQLSSILSDKQGSIVKIHNEYYSKIPHQYCQFHFCKIGGISWRSKTARCKNNYQK